MNPRLALFFIASLAAAAEIPSAEWQIKTAVLAAHPADREKATVLGYDPSGQLVTLREGTNNFICLAADPKAKSFSVACYHKSLEPFMARRRDLRAEGKNDAEMMLICEDEIKSKKLSMPEKGLLSVTSGKVNAATGEVTGLYTRYVIYIPYSTPESTGIPLKPIADGAPWMMFPGTHRAHIMINPPKVPASGTAQSDALKDHK